MNNIDTPHAPSAAITSGRGLRLALFFWSLTAVVAGLWQLTDAVGGPFSERWPPTVLARDWAPPRVLA
jgi:hypothetical protein